MEPGDCLSEASDHVAAVFDTVAAEDCAIAFSGGKESIVLLHVIQRALDMREARTWPRVVLFVEERHRQSAMNQALVLFSTRCMLSPPYAKFQFEVLPCDSLRDGIALYTRVYGNIKTFFVGARSSDNAALTGPVVCSTPGWPPMTRVMPLFSWTYADVWRYIDANDLAYPAPYTAGYTSLGQCDAGQPNPLLRNADGSYKHARCLEATETERKERQA